MSSGSHALNVPGFIPAVPSRIYLSKSRWGRTTVVGITRYCSTAQKIQDGVYDLLERAAKGETEHEGLCSQKSAQIFLASYDFSNTLFDSAHQTWETCGDQLEFNSASVRTRSLEGCSTVDDYFSKIQAGNGANSQFVHKGTLERWVEFDIHHRPPAGLYQRFARGGLLETYDTLPAEDSTTPLSAQAFLLTVSRIVDSQRAA